MATYSHYRHVTYAAHPDGTVHTHVRASRNGIWLNQTGDIEDIKINIGTHSGSSYFCAFYVYCIQWRSQGFQSWGVKGRVREGVYPLPLGVRGLCPRKIFQITDACRRVLAHFSDKNQHIDGCIYACRLW
jgi:hypothetical protein